jgi:hypothetical protein
MMFVGLAENRYPVLLSNGIAATSSFIYHASMNSPITKPLCCTSTVGIF